MWLMWEIRVVRTRGAPAVQRFYIVERAELKTIELKHGDNGAAPTTTNIQYAHGSFSLEGKGFMMIFRQLPAEVKLAGAPRISNSFIFIFRSRCL